MSITSCLTLVQKVGSLPHLKKDLQVRRIEKFYKGLPSTITVGTTPGSVVRIGGQESSVSSLHLYIIPYLKGIVLTQFYSITDSYVPTLLERTFVSVTDKVLTQNYFTTKFKIGCLLLFQGKSC